jgi:hypothetical protein
LGTGLPGGQQVMAEESTEKLIEKLLDYDTGQPEYKNLVKN